MKRNIILSTIITLIVAFLYFYLFLPPINVTSLQFWFYIAFLLFVFAVSSGVQSARFIFTRKVNRLEKLSGILLGIIGLIFVLIVVINFVMSPLFQSSSYAKRITINQDGNFSEDVKPVDFTKLPLLDKDSSQKLGDRVMGQMPELVSQFLVSDLYTQINYNDEIIRVTPLEYNGIFKYFSNRKNGITGYITVDSVNGESNLVKLEKGMKYMPSALFFENLDRYLRFHYPTEIFDEAYFEIDNEGKPYWIVPTIQYKGIGIRKEVKGAIILDPVTGKSQQYAIDEIPTWVDHVYAANLVIEQVDDWGKYKNGFFNSIFGQKDVVATTQGYNYMVMNDDVYLYTGITSVANDEANVGFILTNLRTKETTFYSIPGAEEYSAMASAEGQVQQMKYTSTFPLLINLNGRPTYLMSLKDNAGLVKMYGFVDVEDYQKVSVSDSSIGIDQAAEQYLSKLGTNLQDEATLVWKTIQIQSIKQAMIDGTSYYYITDTTGQRYQSSIKVSPQMLPFLESGMSIQVGYYAGHVTELNVIEIEQMK